MRYLLNVLITIVWAVWLGSLVGMFVCAGFLFHDQPLEIAGPAANTMFHVLGKTELVLALLVVVVTGALVVYYPSKPLLLLLLTLIAAGAMSITTTLGFMPLMDDLRHQGKLHSAEFDRWHHRSVDVMSTEAVLLLVGGALLVTTIAQPTREPRESSVPLSATLS